MMSGHRTPNMSSAEHLGTAEEKTHPTPDHRSIWEGADDEGTPNSPATIRHVGSSDSRPEHAALDSTTNRQSGQRENADASERQHPTRRATESPLVRRNSSPPMTPIPPQVTKRPQKPPNLRRASTKRLTPYRGQEFSVDDDPEEFEENAWPATPQATAFAPLRKVDSTIRRRPTHMATPLPRVDSQDEDEAAEVERPLSREPTIDAEDDNGDEANDEEAAVVDDEELSDTESFTLRDRQLAINQTHPFGIRIWKPALYKKNRSVEKSAEEDIHSSPSASVGRVLPVFNALWTLCFGWWLGLIALSAAGICLLFSIDPSAAEYSKVFWSLAVYLFYPFGQFVKLQQDENYIEEDQGEGRSISEYERWQTGDLEHGRLFFGPLPAFGDRSIVGRQRSSEDSANERESLLGRTGRSVREDTGVSRGKRRLFGRGQWTLGRVVFFVLFYFLVAPFILLVSGLCWLMVFWIPMGRLTMILLYHLRKHPLALSFHPDATYARSSTNPSSVLLCTYRAVGSKYWKYTVDGTNIFLINLLAIVLLVILDYFVLREAVGLRFWLTSPALLFTFALFSIIPLAYFIGQAVASISAQSSMGMGAAVNAFFSTIVEVYLYCVALNEGKGKLVEGSIIGSIFAGVLLLPGLSMCFGALKRKTQRFNVKSAGATSTMLLFATIAAFGPTLFYKIYGSHELICKSCTSLDNDADRDCRQCYFRQVPAINDDFFVQAVRPYCWFAAVLLFSSYVIGLLFTLRTHAAVIWSTEVDEKKPTAQPQQPHTAEISPTETRHMSTANGPSSIDGTSGAQVSRLNVRESPLYKRILGQSLRQVGLPPMAANGSLEREPSTLPRTPPQLHMDSVHNQDSLPHVVPPKSSSGEHEVDSSQNMTVMSGLTEEQNNSLILHVTELAATAAAVAATDVTRRPLTSSTSFQAPLRALRPQESVKTSKPPTIRGNTALEHHGPVGVEQHSEEGGHDAPNWSRTKSSVILLTATVAYAMVAEILVNTVDVVLDSVDIDEKFLGITLFALVPNTTEFLNAISFAMNGNIALSMEIGSAYALQVCLLQIPALVLFSAVHGRWIDPDDLIDHTFNLIFPQWDMVTTILCVFLLSYMYGEGKSNYFKGSILVLTYLVVVMGFYYSGYTTMDVMGVDPRDTLAIISSGFHSSGARGGGTSRNEL